MEQDLSGAIAAEIIKAIAGLSGGKWKAANAIADVLYKEAEKCGAMSDLLSIIGSWGDTLTDEDTLDFLRTYNSGGDIFREVICEVKEE
ncbi:MAG: hypothetical protein J5828_00050 [Desulfovibrionaceae bacterium]|nr:hypothetical protein [Desulfovibrionaceae bacterium]